VRVETRGVLAGAYKGGRAKLDKLRTHAVVVEDDRTERVMCGKIPVEHMVDTCGAEAGPPTCPDCLRRMVAHTMTATDREVLTRRSMATRAYMRGWERGAGHITKGYTLPPSNELAFFQRGQQDGTRARHEAEAAFTEHLRATAWGYIDGEEVRP